MRRTRKTLQKEDLMNGAFVTNARWPSAHFRLGAPKKKNVNLNVVNHCQVYSRKGELMFKEAWFNLSNLREEGFKYHSTPAAGH